MSTVIESDWENERLKEELATLRHQLAEAKKDAEKWREHVARQRRPAHSCDIEGCAVCDPTYGL